MVKTGCFHEKLLYSSPSLDLTPRYYLRCKMNWNKQTKTWKNKKSKCQADSVKRQTLVGRSIFIRNMNFYNSIHKNSIKSKVKRV